MKKFLLLLALSATPALAQEPTPQVRALSERVMQELNTALTCTANVIALQDKIKELEAKLQPKKD